MTAFSRRSLLASPLVLGGIGAALDAMAAPEAKPHFFLQIVIQSGMDSLYLFDARPRIFTQAGLISNYAREEARLWSGSAGGQCWASAHTKLLLPFKDRLAIVNGVHMPQGFDGHEQNLNSLMTANPFGGNYFGPLIGEKSVPLPFVGLGNGSGYTLHNRSRALILDAETANLLAEKAKKSPGSANTKAWKDVVRARAQHCAGGQGSFSKGCAAYGESLDKSASIADKLAVTQVELRPEASNMEKRTAVAISYFKNGLTRTGLIDINERGGIDAHAQVDAADADRNYAGIARDIRDSLQLLADTPFDADKGLSMLDVTTVMIGSEFSRSHMQAGKRVDTTGTDHNTFSNMILFCGKGIRGDLVLGASDLDSLAENKTFKSISAMHKRFDPEIFKRMGKVFDFEQQVAVDADPAAFRADDYITVQTLMNTVLAIFSVPETQWYSNESRNGMEKRLARVLSRLAL